MNIFVFIMINFLANGSILLCVYKLIELTFYNHYSSIEYLIIFLGAFAMILSTIVFANAFFKIFIKGG